MTRSYFPSQAPSPALSDVETRLALWSRLSSSEKRRNCWIKSDLTRIFIDSRCFNRDDINWAEEASWLHDDLMFLMTLRSRDIVSLPPASLHRCQTESLETNTNNRKLDCSDQFPRLFVRPQSGDTDNALLTTSQVVAPPAAQWLISHPTFAGQKKLNQLSVRFRFLGCRPGKTLLTLCTLASSEPRQMPANVRTKVRHFSELI